MRIIYPVNMRFPMERANSIQIANTCRAMAEAGAEVHLIVRRMDAQSDAECLAFYGLEPHPNLRLHRLAALNTHNMPKVWDRSFQSRCLLRIARLCAMPGPRVIYSREIGFAKLLLQLRWLTRAPLVFEVHDIGYLTIRHFAELIESDRHFNEAHERRVRAKEAYLFTHADALVTVTEQLRDIIRREFHTTRPIEVIRNGVRLNAVERSPDPDHPLIVYTGQVYLWKGVGTLVEAMGEVRNAQLVVLGGLPYEPDLAKLQAFAAEHRVADRIQFPGSVEPSRVWEYLSKAHVAVLPLIDTVASRYFTCPLKMLQYMSARVPIVATRLPAVAEVLEHERNALLVDPGKPSQLAAAIQRLLDDPPLAQRLAAQARQDVEALGWSARARAVLDLAERVWSARAETGDGPGGARPS